MDLKSAGFDLCRREDGSAHKLGEGGYGKVYKAQRHEATVVALKVLMAASAPEETGFLQGLELELQVMRGACHPHIVTCFDVCKQVSPFSVLSSMQALACMRQHVYSVKAALPPVKAACLVWLLLSCSCLKRAWTLCKK